MYQQCEKMKKWKHNVSQSKVEARKIQKEVIYILVKYALLAITSQLIRAKCGILNNICK